MRHVQPAFRGENQNLVAYQDGQEIYFLTVRQVDRDEELFVWYGYDYAKRLQVSTYADASEERPMAKYVGNFPQQHTVDVSSLQIYIFISLPGGCHIIRQIFCFRFIHHFFTSISHGSLRNP